MQKRVNDALYVFDLEPFVITDDLDVDVIYVQEEKVNSYKKLNSDSANKIKGFNQFVMAVNKPVWDMSDEPTPGPEPGPDPGYVTITYPTAIRLHNDMTETWVDEEPSTMLITNDTYLAQSQSGYEYSIDNRNGELDNYDITYEPASIKTGEQGMVGPMFRVGTENVTITVESISPKSHTFTFDGYDVHGHVQLYFDTVSVDPLSGPWQVPEGTIIDIKPTEDRSYYSLDVVPEDLTWDTEAEQWTMTMPDEDLTIDIAYTEPVQNYTFTLTGHQILAAVTVDFNNEPVDMNAVTGEWQIPEGTVIGITPTYNVQDYKCDDTNLVWNDTKWTVTMPADDYTITMNFENTDGGGSGES